MMQLEERKLKEIEHSDRRRSIVKGHEYKTDASSDDYDKTFIEEDAEYQEHFSNMKFYSITKSSFAYRDKLLYENVKGAVCLDYCCGNGEIGIEMAKRGAKKVVGIDISQVAVDNANELARINGVDHIVSYKVMDAENTEFANDEFDIIHEYGALHHLDLPAAFKELARVLKPEGKIVCTEAMRHNPVIHWYRNRTPHLRTEWEVEHILGVPEVNSGLEFFNGIEKKMFHLFGLGAVPFRKTFFFKPLLAFLNILDGIFLKVPYFNRLAWVSVIKYTKPKK
jgi:ubiquinone/menaquinone biosynthesis C-methylase UbiE